MEKEILADLFEKCKSSDIRVAAEALRDLEFLAERHATKRYDEESYFLAFNDRSLYPVKLSESDMQDIIYFLFYILLNYPKLSVFAASGICKCYDANSEEGIYQAIELFLLTKSDRTILFLIRAINNMISEIDAITERYIKLILKIKCCDLSESKEFANKLVTSYTENISDLPEKIQELLM